MTIGDMSGVATKIENNDFTAKLRGRWRTDVALGPRCWFQVGGPADFLFTPEDDADLQTFFREVPKDLPVTVIGVGSNLLVRDGGVDGVVVRLGRHFAQIEVHGNEVIAGAGALDLNVATVAMEHSVAGLEFLSGIPGTIGGAVAMNAGAYGREIKDVLVYAEVMLTDGTIHKMTAEDLQLTYRHAELPEGAIVLRAVLKGEAGDKEKIKAAMTKIQEERASTQPIKSRTGGSTFKNPEGKRAWQLVDEAGCRGLMIGKAQVSEKHTNFLINTGDATAAELEALGEEVRSRVKAKSGTELQWEIKRIGRS
ncbi:MAG: UDP-N-acetylmuramate dehydrogenase [Rickettsiales bacterium]